MKTISEEQRLILELFVCLSQAEQRNLSKVKKQYNKLQKKAEKFPAHGKIWALLGKIEFSLGNYWEAGRNFKEASHYLLDKGQEFCLCRNFFNAAASFENELHRGTPGQISAEKQNLLKELVNKCLVKSQKIAFEYNFTLLIFSQYDFLSNHELRYRSPSKALEYLKKTNKVKSPTKM